MYTILPLYLFFNGMIMMQCNLASCLPLTHPSLTTKLFYSMFFTLSLSFPLPCQQSLLQVEESGWNASSLISGKEGRKEGESSGKVTPFTPPQHSFYMSVVVC